MSSINRVTITGRLGADPEKRTTTNKKTVVEFRMAVAETWKGGDGKKQEKVVWVGVQVWEGLAESCAKYLKKGSRVAIDGVLRMDSWEKDGQKHSKLYVVANEVEFLDPKPKGDSAEAPAGPDSDANPFDGDDNVA
jgi:single-strand DNA-binding protein